MTNRLELNWKLDGFVDEQRYYCSEAPIDPLALPTPKAVLDGDVRTYTDMAITAGLTYYVCVSSVKNGVEKLSEQVVLTASQWSPAQIAITPKIFLDDTSMTEGAWNSKTDSNYNFGAVSGVSAPSINNGVLNNLPILRFSGSHGFGSVASLTGQFAKGKKHAYFFIVTKLNNNSNSYKRIFCVPGTSLNNAYSKLSLFNGNVSGLQYWSQVSDNANTERSQNFFTSTDFEMLLLYVNHELGNIEFYRNGLSISQTSVPTELTLPNVSTTNPISLGYYLNQNGSKEQFTHADIACVVANDESITQQEIDKIFGWAAHRYGLTANLPSGHPYKNNPPVV